jgi:hypothetical protein
LDQRWFDSVTLSGDYSVVGYGTNRPFSTFSSIGEYSQAIGISAGILAYQYVVEQIKLREFIFFNLIFVVSAALTASRSALLICSLIAFSPIFFKPRLNTISKMIFPKLIAGAFAASWLIPVIFNLIPVRLLGNAASLLDRQAAGLSGNDSGVTSASVHLFQTNEALVESFKSVIGFGTGAISGAQKFNGITRMNAETDIGNASFAFGIAGFVIMLLIFFGLFAAFSHSVLRQGILLILLLLPSVNNWFNPGHYSTVWVVWLLIGFILRQKHLVTYG